LLLFSFALHWQRIPLSLITLHHLLGQIHHGLHHGHQAGFQIANGYQTANGITAPGTAAGGFQQANGFQTANGQAAGQTVLNLNPHS